MTDYKVEIGHYLIFEKMFQSEFKFSGKIKKIKSTGFYKNGEVNIIITLTDIKIYQHGKSIKYKSTSDGNFQVE